MGLCMHISVNVVCVYGGGGYESVIRLGVCSNNIGVNVCVCVCVCVCACETSMCVCKQG